MADHTKRMAQIREILRSGAQQVTVDGTTVIFDLTSLRRELRELQLDDDNERGKRPVVSTVRLGG